MSRRKTRFWADEEKREICAQATTPGMSVAQVARRYAVNANLILKWLKDPRPAPDASASAQEATFLPVEIEADVAVEPAPIDVPMPSPPPPPFVSGVDITLLDGRRIAHVRCKFVDVFASQGNAIAEEAIRRIAELYAVEKESRGKAPEARVALR